MTAPPPMSAEARTAPRRAPSRPAAGNGDRPAGRVEALTLLGDRHLLALTSGAPAEGELRSWLADGGVRRRLSVETVATAGDAAILLVGGSRRPLAVPAAGAFAIEPPERFGARLLERFDGAARAQLQERVVARAGAEAGPALAVLHEATRERLPAPAAGPAAACTAHVDAFWRVDGSSYYVEGWACDRSARLRSLRLLTPEGRRVDLLARAYRYSRPDVCEFLGMPAGERLGFIAFVDLPEESTSGGGWLLQGEVAGGADFEVAVPPVIDDPLAVRTTVLGDVQLDGGDGALLRGHVAPAIERLQRRLSDAAEIATVDQHGTPPEDPEVTIVVPLYRRTDYLEHQLAQFVHDPELRRADLVYVLDSPEEAPRLRRFAAHLHDLYGVPFRLAVLSTNAGFSAANNLGASLARGRKLLLLNSDVLPAAPGWLSRMVAFYDAHPEIGALAPKLLYEDDSIQHAGLCFERVAGGSASWSNEHFYKGLHRRFESAGVTRAVPAVTGACLLIDLELYRELGGLRGLYVRGDYEDSDLCLRLREQGREAWYLADVELYHLEGQSYPTPERAAASRYNQWLHGELWREALSELEGAA